jgi:2-oxoglutarate dehydrogenase E1 component
VTRVVLCSGKVYFDLLKARREAKAGQRRARAHRAALSVPGRGISGGHRKYANAREVVWCQEEPQNQGAGIRSATACRSWPKRELLYAGRAGAAAPATGIARLHEQQQKNLVAAALQGHRRKRPPDKRCASRSVAQTRTGS